MTDGTATETATVRVVFFASAYNERRRANDDTTWLGEVHHGDSLKGTNPVAVLDGTLCPKKKGCLWCTGLRDRIRSRTVR